MEYGSMSIQQLQSGRWLNWGIRFFLTAALTASQTAGGYAPFALGCIAAAGPGADGAAALLGGVTGALLFLDFQQVLALAAVGILILTAATAFRDTTFLQKPWVLPVLAAGMVLAVGGIYVLQSLDPLSHAAPCAAASALTNQVGVYIYVPFFAYYLAADLSVSIAWIYFTLKGRTGLSRWAALCCPVATLVFGQLFHLLPWPVGEIGVAFESLGYVLLLAMGLRLCEEPK